MEEEKGCEKRKKRRKQCLLHVLRRQNTLIQIW